MQYSWLTPWGLIMPMSLIVATVGIDNALAQTVTQFIVNET